MKTKPLLMILMIVVILSACNKNNGAEEVSVNAPAVELRWTGGTSTAFVGDTIPLVISVSNAIGLIASVGVSINSGSADVLSNQSELNALEDETDGSSTVRIVPTAPGLIEVEVLVADQQSPANETRETIILTAELANQIQLFTNPSNPAFLMVENDTASIVYSGAKNPSGAPQSLDNIFYHDNLTNEDFSFAFNEDNTPKRALSSSGEAIEFIYENGSLTRLLLTNEEGYRVNIPIDEGSSSGRLDGSQKAHVSAREGSVRILSQRGHSDTFTNYRTSQANNELFIDIEKCGFPVGGTTVLIDLKGDTDFFTQTITGQQVSEGRYVFGIPEPSATLDTNVESYCDDVTGVIEGVCTAVSLVTAGGKIDPAFICPVIAAAFAATPIPGDEVLVFAGCDKMLRILGRVCTFVSISAGAGSVFDDPNLPSLGISDACGFLDEFDDTASQYEITPKLFLPGEGFVQLDKFSVNSSGPYVDQSYNIDLPTSFASFFTSPIDPAPGQDYVASVEIECAELGAKATISVLGTDGFTDSETVTVTDSFTRIDFGVPGAADGVKDIITVELSTGQVTSTSIVF